MRFCKYWFKNTTRIYHKNNTVTKASNQMEEFNTLYVSWIGYFISHLEKMHLDTKKCPITAGSPNKLLTLNKKLQ